MLLEKGALASGASGRSSALVRMHYTNEWDTRLAWASFRFAEGRTIERPQPLSFFASWTKNESESGFAIASWLAIFSSG